jgi:hypothetical protein
MRVTELIDRLETILDQEGNVEVELPDGTLLKRVEMVTVRKEPDGPKSKNRR